MRQISLVGFLQAQNCTTIPAAWRHPEARLDFTSPDYYQHIGRVLEAGKFDLGFFDDRLAMPDMYSGDHVHTVENGIRCVKMDPTTVLTVMGMATTHLGLGATYSTTYHEPFHVARLFSTLDHMTNGRAAWNVVTSVNDNEARNMGMEQAVGHDDRYDRADEFMQVVHGHWDTWEDDALVLDRSSGLFADGTKVHRLDHVGPNFRSRGPFTVPRTPQGHPVVIQAGQSGRGQKFAARWGELLFVNHTDMATSKAAYDAVRAEAATIGRDPEQMRITNLVFPVVGRTLAEAEDKKAAYDELPKDIDELSLLSEGLNFDFSVKDLDDPFTDEELEGLSGIQAIRDRVTRATGKANPTTRDFMKITSRAQLNHAVVGGPTELADYFEQWFTEPACDGFVIGGSHTPGTFEDLVELVVPELQRRGLFRREYTGSTLRDHLGLGQPSLGSWRMADDGA
ncbi:MAG: FMN-dependent oxidoreductase (nitrilotriacetate monooxygenase family) [Acidimicrobiales bacterium]|jgi:FMN-dependent oxidoreductase (nitrilotriacetate monooxygenase family)